MKIILLCLTCFISFSQTSKAYESISVSLSGYKQVLDNEINTYYKSTNNLSLRIETPYHTGTFYVGLKRYKFRKTTRSTTHFSSNYIYIGWQNTLIRNSNFKVDLGFHLGSFEMDFDQESRWFYKKESEFSTSIQSSVSYSFTREINLFFRFENQHIYTSRKIYLNTISSGFSYSFRTPLWLKTLLN